MTIATVKSHLINTVIDGFAEKALKNDTSPITWITEHLFNPASSQSDVDNFAKGILTDFHVSIPKNDSKRYRFSTLRDSDELLKLIFEEGFHHDPQAVIQSAERIDGSFYPLWKRACLIYIPKVLGGFFGNPLVRVAIVIATVYYSYKLGMIAFIKMVHVFTARGIPFLVNNTPTMAFQLSNRILNAVDWARQHTLLLLIGAFFARKIVLLGPTIPYFTAAVRSIDLWNIGWALYGTPVTLFGFLIQRGLYGAQFTVQTSLFLTAFFNSVAAKAQGDCLAVSKSKSYAVWKKVVAEKIPQRLDGSK